MYDRVTNYTAPNPINRYHLADYNDLKKNADGSITLYLQTASPGPDLASNWLPAPPGPFYLILRNYAPGPDLPEQLKHRATFQGPPGSPACSGMRRPARGESSTATIPQPIQDKTTCSAHSN